MRLALAALLLAGFAFFYYQGHRQSPAPPEPAALDLPPTPVLSMAQIVELRRSTRDLSPDVRWAALQLLFTLKDPEIVEVMDKIVAQDPDPEIRRRGVELLSKARNEGSVLPPIIRGLGDPEKDVRVSCLRTLADIGDPAAIPWITESLKDSEPEVRAQALRSLGLFQDQRRAQFEALAKKLRDDYAAALKRSQASPIDLLGQPRRR